MDNTIIEKEKKCGIYKITNTKNDKVYIGQSVNLDKRIYSHKYHLKTNTHYNKALQNSFNKYEGKSFAFEIIEECEISDLDEKECFWISFFNSTERMCGFNFEGGGNANKSVHQDTIEKIRKTLKVQRIGKGNPMYGRKLPAERKEQMRMVNRGRSGKLMECDVREIKMALYLGISQSELAKLFNVKVDTINKIAYGNNWGWCLEYLNNDIVSMYKQKEQERNIRIKELFDDGMTTTEIIKLMHCDQRTITKAVGASRVELREERNRDIISDYEQGIKQKEIAKKYNLEESGLRRILSAAIQRKREETYNRVLELHEQGVKNIDIAITLGIHRTTVTEYLKGRVAAERRKSKPLTNELEREILRLIREGKSQREVSRLLEVSRHSIKKAMKGA